MSNLLQSLLLSLGLIADDSEYQMLFSAATDCYRKEEYQCAQAGFAAAAWLAESPVMRAPAVFNLANAHFFNGEFSDAVVLYREAGYLGVDAERVAINLAYAEVLEASMRQLQLDLAKSAEKAEWRSEAGEMPEALRDLLSQGLFIGQQTDREAALTHIPAQQLEALFRGRLTALLAQQESGVSGSRWIQTDTTEAGSTAQLFNRLLALELGLPNTRNTEPRIVEGERPW